MGIFFVFILIITLFLELLKHYSAVNLIKTYLEAIKANRIEYHWVVGFYGRDRVEYFFKFYIVNDVHEGYLKYHLGKTKWIIDGGEVQSPIQFRDHLND